VRVSDDGQGLPPDLGDKIFDPFMSTKETGMGLGLSISKRVAEAHGGAIEAIDRPGGGAIFIVRLPMEHMPAEGPAASLAAEAP
jgi:signal transduction histidine kinase